MLKDDDRVDGSSRAPREIDRRTIAKGVAWTVPVVIVATAAPAAATSRMTATPTIASASLDSHPTGQPSLRLVGKCVSNESGTVQLLSVTQGQFRGISVSVPLVVGPNDFDITLDPGFTLSPGSVSIAYEVLDSGGVRRGSGSVTQMVAAYTTVTKVEQSGSGSTKTLTVTFGNQNPKSALVIESIKNGTATGSANWGFSHAPWEDIGTGTVSLTAKRPGNGDNAVVKGTIDGQAFTATATGING